jgi:hypothetical protein
MDNTNVGYQRVNKQKKEDPIKIEPKNKGES